MLKNQINLEPMPHVCVSLPTRALVFYPNENTDHVSVLCDECFFCPICHVAMASVRQTIHEIRITQAHFIAIGAKTDFPSFSHSLLLGLESLRT